MHLYIKKSIKCLSMRMCIIKWRFFYTIFLAAVNIIIIIDDGGGSSNAMKLIIIIYWSKKSFKTLVV